MGCPVLITGVGSWPIYWTSLLNGLVYSERAAEQHFIDTVFGRIGISSLLIWGLMQTAWTVIDHFISKRSSALYELSPVDTFNAVSKSPNLRTIWWHWIFALPYITDSVTWICFTDCWSVVRGETWMQRLLDFVGQDRRLKNGTCNKAGFWSVPHFLLLRWVLIRFDPFKCNMHIQSVYLYHAMSLFVYVCATGGCFSCYSALRSNSLVSRK